MGKTAHEMPADVRFDGTPAFGRLLNAGYGGVELAREPRPQARDTPFVELCRLKQFGLGIWIIRRIQALAWRSP